MSEIQSLAAIRTFKTVTARLAVALTFVVLPATALAQSPPPAALAAAAAPVAAPAAAPPAAEQAPPPPPPPQPPAPAAAPDAAAAHPQPAGDRIGGHLGVAFPLLMAEHPTKNIGDQFNVAAPIGVTVKVADALAVDFEVVVATHIHQHSAPTGLTIDPGVVYNWGPVATGLRVKFDINSPPNIGVIPLINRGLVDLGGATWFIEAAFPTTYVNDKVNFDVVFHTGIGF
jgi:hypothetical protein